MSESAKHLERSNSDKWRMAVHALNVLRLVLLDATLGSDLDPYLTDATICSIQGFRSSKWAVRNSSMMLFASIIQRAVDNEKHDSGGSKATSVIEFFTRFPHLYPFLLSELSDIMASYMSRKNSKKKYASVDEFAHLSTLHPSLYPILLLFSKLRCSATLEDVSEGPAKIDVSVFIPLIECCASQNMQKVRQIAAKSLASLTPLKESVHKSTHLLGKLVEDLSETDSLSQTSLISSNEFQGRLLLIYEVLDAFSRHCGRLGDLSAILSSIRYLQDFFLPLCQKLRPFVMKVKKNCPPVQYVYFDVLKSISMLEKEHSEDTVLQKLWFGDISLMVQVLQHSPVDFQLPYQSILYRSILDTAVELSIDLGFKDTSIQNSDFFQKICDLSRHSVSEIREGLLIGLNKVLLKYDNRDQNRVKGEFFFFYYCISSEFVRLIT
jgi:hypothetical protein